MAELSDKARRLLTSVKNTGFTTHVVALHDYIAALESVASAAREADGLLTAHGSTGTVLLRAMMKIREALRRIDGDDAGGGTK